MKKPKEIDSAVTLGSLHLRQWFKPAMMSDGQIHISDSPSHLPNLATYVSVLPDDAQDRYL